MRNEIKTADLPNCLYQSVPSVPLSEEHTHIAAGLLDGPTQATLVTTPLLRGTWRAESEGPSCSVHLDAHVVLNGRLTSTSQSCGGLRGGVSGEGLQIDMLISLSGLCDARPWKIDLTTAGRRLRGRGCAARWIARPFHGTSPFTT